MTLLQQVLLLMGALSDTLRAIRVSPFGLLWHSRQPILLHCRLVKGSQFHTARA